MKVSRKSRSTVFLHTGHLASERLWYSGIWKVRNVWCSIEASRIGDSGGELKEDIELAASLDVDCSDEAVTEDDGSWRSRNALKASFSRNLPSTFEDSSSVVSVSSGFLKTSDDLTVRGLRLSPGIDGGAIKPDPSWGLLCAEGKILGILKVGVSCSVDCGFRDDRRLFFVGCLPMSYREVGSLKALSGGPSSCLSTMPTLAPILEDQQASVHTDRI